MIFVPTIISAQIPFSYIGRTNKTIITTLLRINIQHLFSTGRIEKLNYEIVVLPRERAHSCSTRRAQLQIQNNKIVYQCSTATRACRCTTVIDNYSIVGV